MSAVTENRKLKMHNKLLMDVIRRQAGTFDKAILEGCMNAIEAGATKVDITFDADGDQAMLNIADNGKGISERREIEEFFETFGTPHEESEGKIWAQFRMGRGQLFSFGRNVWRTSQFEMTVDIEDMGLDYRLTHGLSEHGGCSIEVYLYKNPITKWYSTEKFKSDIANLVQFMPVPIRFNGEQINIPAADCEWTCQDADAYYLFGAGTSLKLYNLGAFVKSVDANSLGVCGVVVSKRQLQVNFARNDVMSECEVWGRMGAVIAKNRKVKVRSRQTLTPGERIATLADLRDGMEDLRSIKMKGLIKTSSGNHMSLDAVMKNRMPWSFAEHGDRQADRIMQHDRALVLDDAILADLGYTGDQSRFFSWLTDNDEGHWDWEPHEKMWRPMSALREQNDGGDQYVLIPHGKWTAGERKLVRMLEGSCDEFWEGRNIVIGISTEADAWTDGESYIALHRDMVKSVGRGGGGMDYLIAVMQHEVAHDERTDGTHNHGPEFYERFHNITVKRNNPIRLAAYYTEKMKAIKSEDWNAKQVKKAQKAEDKVREKLGIAAKKKAQ